MHEDGIGYALPSETENQHGDDYQAAANSEKTRQNACNGIQVKDVLRVVPQSRTLLESRFKRLIGRTPHEEILRVRLNRVKELLVETDLSLDEIAERTAFNHVEYLSVAFRREIGIPPSQFRAQNRP